MRTSHQDINSLLRHTHRERCIKSQIDTGQDKYPGRHNHRFRRFFKGRRALRALKAAAERSGRAQEARLPAEEGPPSLANLNDDCLGAIVLHAARAMEADEADLADHEAYMRRALFGIYCWVARMGALCTAMHRAATVELMVRRAAQGDAYHHLDYTRAACAAFHED
ncbi:MAG: hypothetical protein HN793_14310, partial [Rhodospirillaceae bacterium]|nr:hypothetical protein [Rhodospirillaceae bacterium]